MADKESESSTGRRDGANEPLSKNETANQPKPPKSPPPPRRDN